MDEKTARDMDNLLAEGELSGPEADAIEKRVFEALDRAEGKKRPASVIRYLPAAAGGVLATAAALLLVLRVGLPGGDPGVGPMQQEEGVMGVAVIEIRCEGGTLEACPATASLVFVVKSDQKKVFLSAYAEPVRSEGARVVYFEEQGGAVEIAVPREKPHAAERRLRLPAVQAPGRYRVHAFVGDRPLGREATQQSRQNAALAETRVELVIVE